MEGDFVVRLKIIPNVLGNRNITSWSIAFKGEQTFEAKKHSLAHACKLGSSQIIHTSIIGGGNVNGVSGFHQELWKSVGY